MFFNKKNDKDITKDPSGLQQLEIAASMQGALSFKDPVHLLIHGSFEGTLETRGILEISQKAVVRAHIKGERVMILGEVIGNVSATQGLELGEAARLTGDVRTPSLTVKTGAILQGSVIMSGGAQPVEREREETPGGLLGVDELAAYLSVEKALICEWADSGRLPAQKRGANWRFDKKKVDEWVASGMIQ